MSKERYMKFFEEADVDEDGYLSLEELTAILVKKGYKIIDSEILTMFKAADTIGDNRISIDEYLDAMGQKSLEEHRNATMRACFRTFDKNGDGKIDSAELDQVFREEGKIFPREAIDRIIQLMDKDKNGTIDYEEFIARFATGYLNGKTNTSVKSNSSTR